MKRINHQPDIRTADASDDLIGEIQGLYTAIRLAQKLKCKRDPWRSAIVLKSVSTRTDSSMISSRLGACSGSRPGTTTMYGQRRVAARELNSSHSALIAS